jgi:hypothetical protein
MRIWGSRLAYCTVIRSIAVAQCGQAFGVDRLPEVVGAQAPA